MKTINIALEKISGNLLSITRNTEFGWYELEIGIPATWAFKDNNDIACIIITETERGKILKISPKFENIVIDDLVSFVEVIIETNKKIVERENDFLRKIESIKLLLEDELSKHNVELDELKETSFLKLGQVNSGAPLLEVKPKRGRKPGTVKSKTEE